MFLYVVINYYWVSLLFEERLKLRLKITFQAVRNDTGEIISYESVLRRKEHLSKEYERTYLGVESDSEDEDEKGNEGTYIILLCLNWKDNYLFIYLVTSWCPRLRPLGI